MVGLFFCECRSIVVRDEIPCLRLYIDVFTVDYRIVILPLIGLLVRGITLYLLSYVGLYVNVGSCLGVCVTCFMGL